MNRNVITPTAIAALTGAILLAATSPAAAGDHELWREQVETRPQVSTTLAVAPGRKASGAREHLLWRDQLESAPARRIFVAPGGRTRSAPAYALWREQVELGAREPARRSAASSNADRG